MLYSIPLYSIYFMFGVVVIALDTHLYDSITEPNSLTNFGDVVLIMSILVILDEEPQNKLYIN